MIGQLARRELVQRYRGSALGFLWAVATPLLLLAVYTFVFSLVFQVSWSAAVDDHGSFEYLFKLVCASIEYDLWPIENRQSSAPPADTTRR